MKFIVRWYRDAYGTFNILTVTLNTLDHVSVFDTLGRVTRYGPFLFCHNQPSNSEA